MKPYLSPRRNGIDRLDIYTDGYARYLSDCGETRLVMAMLDGTEPYESARNAIVQQIGRGYPIPTLILNHRRKELQDYVWHWFLINGYDESYGEMMVKTVTYSGFQWFDLRKMWDTGYNNKGGLVPYRLEQ